MGRVRYFLFSNFRIFMNFNYKYIYICIRVFNPFFFKSQNVDIGRVCPAGHPRMYVCPMLGEDQGLIRVLDEKLARLTHRVPTIRIEQIPAIMQEIVVRIPSTWIRLMRRVSRVVLVYIDATEASAAEEAEEVGDQGD